MDDQRLEEMMDKLAGSIIAFHEDIQKHVQGLSNEEIQFIIQKISENKHPIWQDIARQLEFDLKMNDMAKAAQEYMEATGETVYCPHCKGKCTPEHLAELD